MLDIYTFVFINKASFLQDGFGVQAYVKDDDGKKYHHSFFQDNIANMYVYNRFSHPACSELSIYFIYYIINQHRFFDPVCSVA